MCQFNDKDYHVGVLTCATGPKEKLTINNMFQRKREINDFVSVSSYRDWIETTSITLTEVWFECYKFTVFIYMFA